MGGIMWGSICFAFEYYFAGTIPFAYALITPLNFWFFAKTKNFKLTRFIQVLISLLLPFLFQWSLGGFVSSGVMMLWAVLAVIGSLSFYETRASRIWIGLFILFTLVSWYIDPFLHEYTIDANQSVNTMFFVLNVLIVSSAVYLLVVFFINIRDKANIVLERQHNELQQSQAQLIQSEKLAALGQLIAGVAHEVNTPLGAIQASIGIIRDAIKSSIESFPEVLENLSSENKVLFFDLLEDAFNSKSINSSKDERTFRRKMTQKLEEDGIENAEDISDVLVDIGITEVDPKYYPLLKDENVEKNLNLIYNQTEQCKNSDNIKIAVERASKIVFALKSYSRFDSSGKKIDADLKSGVETILTLYHNQIKQGVTVNKNFKKIPLLNCFPDELNQVWTNIVHNAIQAMNNNGRLDINISKTNDSALIQFTDSGKGIPEEVRARIIEPFFTTKPAGEGSGLGLDIVKKIVDKHNGEIFVESEPGKTEEFISPNVVLQKVKKGIIKTLKQEDGSQKDGMDASLVNFDLKTKILCFSGAFNPLYIIRSGNKPLVRKDGTEVEVDKVSDNQHLYVIKGSKQPLAFHRGNEEDFTLHEFQMEENDEIFMFSDGYPDQFGGEKNKKFRHNRFKDLLISLNGKESSAQKKEVIDMFNTWKKDLEQIDDVCVFGARL